MEVDLPFKCNYCENYYCPEHRLPENHNCTETWRVKALKSARQMSAPFQTGTTSGIHSMLIPARTRSMRFSRTEVKHLIIGLVLVTAVGVSSLRFSFFNGSVSSVLALAVATILFAMGFILHELSHKYVAQRYGLWAEFRVYTMGLLLTAISIVSPLKFIAPGAVVISGGADRDRMGLTAVAGPIVNVIIALVLLASLPAVSASILYGPFVAGAAINAFLALFNLIPFAILDGKKVYLWNRTYWAVLFVLSLILTVYTYFL